ncbi:MAG: Gx transporter family protein, partial [Clostridia bacterium]
MKDTRNLALSALLVAIMLILGYIENMIPTGPVPGIKLGLSNGVLLLAIYWLGIP